MKKNLLLAAFLLGGSAGWAQSGTSVWRPATNNTYSAGVEKPFAGIELEERGGAVVVKEKLVRYSSAGEDFHTGDIVRRIGDRSVATLRDWNLGLKAHKPGDTVEVVVERDGKALTLPVKLDRIYEFRHAN